MSQMTWKEIKDCIESNGVEDDDIIYGIEIFKPNKEFIFAVKTQHGWLIEE